MQSSRVQTLLRVRAAVAALLLTFCGPSIAADLVGRVVGVQDGDSITVLVGGREQIKVRLDGIDAPENGQEFSRNAKEGLSRLVFGQDITLRVTGKDRYERTLGTVYAAGVNVNLQLVRNGLAWHYKKYSDDPELAEAENQARAGRVGLWAGFAPIPPWEYRELKRTPQGITSTADDEPTTPGTASASYWLNTSSNVRHNSSCRWFGKTSKGRACSAKEGKPCGMCGG